MNVYDHDLNEIYKSTPEQEAAWKILAEEIEAVPAADTEEERRRNMRVYTYRLTNVFYGDGIKAIAANTREQAETILKNDAMGSEHPCEDWELEDIFELEQPKVIAHMVYEE